jgi:hypothetical protein
MVEWGSYIKRKMTHKKQLLQYLLHDIECFQHDAFEYPAQIKCPYNGDLLVGKSYTADQYACAEERIREYFAKQGEVVEVMNPLYQFNNRAETVITIDILLRNQEQNRIDLENQAYPEWFEQILGLIDKHERRKEEIFAFGGDLSMERSGNAQFSNDKLLQKLERHIQMNVLEGGRIDTLLRLVVEGDEKATKVLQWVPKDKSIIQRLIDSVTQTPSSFVQQNLILRQLIPCSNLLSDDQAMRLVVILDTLLRTAVPNVRNKILCILSELPADSLGLLSKDCRMFVSSVAKTKQLNCSCPAWEILEKLNPSKA